MTTTSKFINAVPDAWVQQLGFVYRNIIGMIYAYSCVYLTRPLELVSYKKPQRISGESDADYLKRLQPWFDTTMNNVGRNEQSLKSERSQTNFREQLQNDPLFANLVSQRGTPNADQVFSASVPPAMTMQTLRQRTYSEANVASMIFLSAVILATSSGRREAINKAFMGIKVPSILNEELKSHRSSRCGNHTILPIMEGLSADDLRLLNIERTLLDRDWLLTDNGLQALVALFVRLSYMESNYIALEEFVPVPLDSGFTTTKTALTCEADANSVEKVTEPRVHFSYFRDKASMELITPDKMQEVVPQVVVKLHPNHSYGDGQANFVHIMDSIGFGRVLLNAQTTNQIIIGDLSPSAVFDFTSQQFAHYINFRGIGEIKNWVPREQEPKDRGDYNRDQGSEGNRSERSSRNHNGSGRGRGGSTPNTKPGSGTKTAKSGRDAKAADTAPSAIMKFLSLVLGLFRNGFITKRSMFRILRKDKILSRYVN